MTYSDIPRAMRRTPHKTDWKEFWANLAWLLGALTGLACWTFAAMIAGAWMTMQWQRPHVSYALPVHTAGAVKSLASVCARAASEGALTGDLLTYCN